MLPATVRMQSARACFEKLPTHMLASGCIMLELLPPFYITSCSGMAAQLLRTSSSKLVGRRSQAIAQPAEFAKLQQEICTALEVPYRRTYLSLATVTVCVHVAIQKGLTEIEVLLFIAEPGSWLEDTIFDTTQSLAVAQGASLGADSPDKDLAMFAVEGDDNEVSASVTSAELTGKLLYLEAATSSKV